MFVIALMVLCGSLTFLQYRWTGDVARAETTLMRERLARQAGLLCKSFDDELVKSRAALVPNAQELEEGTRDAVFSKKMRQWKAANRLPVFKRMAVVSGDNDEFMEMDVESASLTPMDWPKELNGFRYEAAARRFGSPPFGHFRGTGLQRAFSVTDTRKFDFRKVPTKWSGRNTGAERSDKSAWSHERGEWNGWHGDRTRVILELDVNYLRDTWMPALIAEYLNPDGKLVYDVVVRSKTPPKDVYFSSIPDSSPIGEKALSLDFNHFASGPERSWGGLPSAHWVMDVSYRAGSLETVVAKSRRWNLAIAVTLNALILVSGWMLVRATRRSRKTAEEQMRFVTNVTHELRTPLTVIRGAAHNLKRGIVKGPEAIGSYSDSILKHAEELSAMVDQILDLSGGHRNKTIRAPMNLGQLLRDNGERTHGLAQILRLSVRIRPAGHHRPRSKAMRRQSAAPSTTSWKTPPNTVARTAPSRSSRASGTGRWKS